MLVVFTTIGSIGEASVTIVVDYYRNLCQGIHITMTYLASMSNDLPTSLSQGHVQLIQNLYRQLIRHLKSNELPVPEI